MTFPLLACGHTANATDADTGRPLCIAHITKPEGHIRAYLVGATGTEDRYDLYLETFHAARAISRAEFLAGVDDGTYDPAPYAEWLLDEPDPAEFFDWVAETYDETPHWLRYTPLSVGYG